jgi:hypothetical protein
VGPDGTFLKPNDTVARGDSITVFANGFEAGGLVKYSLFTGTKEVVFGYGYADANGSTSYRFNVPTDLNDGVHKFAASGATAIVVFPFTVATSSDPSATATSSSGSSHRPSASSTDAGSNGSNGNELAGTGAPPSLFLMGLVTLLLLLVGANLVLPRPEVAGARGRHAPAPRGRAKGRHA